MNDQRSSDNDAATMCEESWYDAHDDDSLLDETVENVNEGSAIQESTQAGEPDALKERKYFDRETDATSESQHASLR